jgi:hypothetical protein
LLIHRYCCGEKTNYNESACCNNISFRFLFSSFSSSALISASSSRISRFNDVLLVLVLAMVLMLALLLSLGPAGAEGPSRTEGPSGGEGPARAESPAEGEGPAGAEGAEGPEGAEGSA